MIRWSKFATKVTRYGKALQQVRCDRSQPIVLPSKHCFRALSTQTEKQKTSPSCHPRRRNDAMRQLLQRHGSKLANVNPLRPDGFLLQPSKVRSCLPKSMIPVLDVLKDIRSRKPKMNDESICFLKELKTRMDAEHVTIHEDDMKALGSLIHSYCNHIGFEFDHCKTEAERQFFISAIEAPEELLSKAGFEKFEPSWMMEQLYRTQVFEQLLQERYSNAKIFGIGGMEAATLAINTIVETFALAANNADCEVFLGTSHRGRISYLGNCLRVPWTRLISDWDESQGPTYDDITDPCSQILRIASNNQKGETTCRLTMLPIPCHLEAMVPGLAGAARAQAMELGRGEKHSAPALAHHLVLPLSLHGDSSFCGQGIIQETLQLSTFRQYESGGTIHLLLNNQVGFTTELSSIKSDRFQGVQSSDIMKSIDAPIVRVNANKPQAVVTACQLAVLYRQTFGADILIELVGSRRKGHNEMDDPTMTNVKLQAAVVEMEAVTESFQRDMEKASYDLGPVREKVDRLYQAAKGVRRDAPQHEHYDRNIGREQAWSRLGARSLTTSISAQLLRKASAPLVTIPDGFKLHPLVAKVVKARRKMLQSDQAIDWATAELLGLSSMACEGTLVRLSGEDSERGTFAQRHAVWHDVDSFEEHQAFPPLMEVANSPLSELGVVGFEWGWTLVGSDSLALWEAQFGDFSNEAQVIFDTLVASSRWKWNVESNIVFLLPHGYDGMGPEHSSARPERWLQLFSSNGEASRVNGALHNDPVGIYESCNFVVACPTEPANYFHLLRRQLAWPFRRPLIVLTPKRTLRNPSATSPLSDIIEGDGKNEFSCVLDDPYWKGRDKHLVKGVLICSGELYFDLLKLREQKGELLNVALVRLEQLAPFPGHQLNATTKTYPNLVQACFSQEDAANYGPLPFVRDQIAHKRLVPVLKNVPFQWISRPESAAPAIGHPHKHATSQEKLLNDILEWSESF